MPPKASVRGLSPVAGFERLLIWFSPLGLAAIVAGWQQHARFSGNWVCLVHLGLLAAGLAVALLRRRLPPNVRLAAYSLCFAFAGGAEAFGLGVVGGGLLLSFIAVLLAAVSDSRGIRWLTGSTVVVLQVAAIGLHGAGVLSVENVAAYATAPATGISSLLLFGFAFIGVAFWNRLSEGLCRTNEELTLAEGHFRMMFAIAGDAALIAENGRFLETNAQAQVAFGYAAAEFHRMTWAELSPACQANGRSSAEEAQRFALAAEAEPQHFRWMFCRKDGRLFEAEVALSSTLRGPNRIQIAIIHDLSDYRIVERENRLLATALNHAGEAVAITDAAGLIVYVNRAFEQITGYSRHEVHGRNPRVLKSGRHDAEFYRVMWSTIASGQAWRGRMQNRRKDGSIYTENICITPLRDERGAISHYVAVKRDISRELELEEQLVQSRKMEAVGRLAGGIAHDFNNILQVITGNVAMAAMDAPAGHPVHGSLDEIARAGERAVRLVEQLLAFSRREEPKLRPVEIGALVADTARMLRRLIGEDITLDIPTPARPLHVLADPGRIEQVLLNLCVNSRDALPDGGRITVETEEREIDESYCAGHPDARPGRYVVVAVSDDGCGIPKEIQHRIFEPFFSTKEVGRGTGLGLATVYAIVKQHGGFIHLYSEIGLGTTFRFYLPAAPVGATEAPAPVPAGATELRGRGETILIAEDDEQVLAIASRVLAQAGYRVLVAHDGDEALDLHAMHTGPIHLAILDVVMPRRNGRLTYDVLRLRAPALRVIFATGYSYHHLQDGLFEQTPVLRKPFTPHELLATVRAALDANAAPVAVATH